MVDDMTSVLVCRHVEIYVSAMWRMSGTRVGRFISVKCTYKGIG